MRFQNLLLSILFTAFSVSAFADDCSVTIDSTDSMQFDKKTMTVSKACKEFTVNLTHSGILAEKVMGHNWVLTKTSDVRPVATDGMSAGLENNYVKKGDERVIAFTEVIGGGEKTSVTFSVDELSENGDYTFFCSFPGHYTVMQGKLIVTS